MVNARKAYRLARDVSKNPLVGSLYIAIENAAKNGEFSLTFSVKNYSQHLIDKAIIKLKFRGYEVCYAKDMVGWDANDTREVKLLMISWRSRAKIIKRLSNSRPM